MRTKEKIYKRKISNLLKIEIFRSSIFSPTINQSKKTSGPENHGSVHVLLLGCAFCVANLQHVALADFTANDSARLEAIQTSLTGGNLGGFVHDGILWKSEEIANSLLYMSNGQYLRDTQGNQFSNYFTSWGAGEYLSTPVANGPHQGLSMVQALNAIGMGLGTITTNGYWQAHQLSLPQLILGWDKNIYNPAVRTNGVIGRIDAMRDSMESMAEKTEEYQNSVTGLLQNIAGQMSVMANNQTNAIFSQVSLEDVGRNYWKQFVDDWNLQGHVSIDYNPFSSYSLYTLPYFLIPSEIDVTQYYSDDADWLYQGYADMDGLRDLFYKYYGNYATYDGAFNQGNDYGQYEFEGSSNILSQTRATRPALTNDNPTTLLPIQGIPELSGDVTDFISIKNDYSNLTGPSQAEITKWTGYFENTVAESQETAGFKFGITFAGVGNEEVTIETEDVDFFESINLQRISQIGNTWIRYGVSIVKGLLMLLFVWSVAEKAVGIFMNNGMQAG